MPTETELAFAPPEARAEASAPQGLADRISLREHIVEVEIGAFQQERGTTQRVQFDVVVELRPAPPAGDDVDRILSYDRIAEAIADALAEGRMNLLETLAEGVASRLLAMPQAARVFVRIQKLDRGPGALGVEIVRSRAAAPVAGTGAAPHPMVVYLDAAAIAAPDLASRLDAWEAEGVPLILAVGLPDGPRPVAGAPAAQRRIDLLAIEQAAWVLAGRDRRCVVVATRTEIDWAMRHGQTVVWAPSKLVLDSVDGPRAADPVALALWLAESFAAVRLIVHGPVAPPAGSRVPVSRAPG